MCSLGFLLPVAVENPAVGSHFLAVVRVPPGKSLLGDTCGAGLSKDSIAALTFRSFCESPPVGTGVSHHAAADANPCADSTPLSGPCVLTQTVMLENSVVDSHFPAGVCVPPGNFVVRVSCESPSDTCTVCRTSDASPVVDTASTDSLCVCRSGVLSENPVVDSHFPVGVSVLPGNLVVKVSS